MCDNFSRDIAHAYPIPQKYRYKSWSKNWNRNIQRSRIRFATCGSTFDPGKLRQQLAEIDKQAEDPSLWSNQEKSQQVMRERKRLQDVLATEDELVRRESDIQAYFDLAKEGETVEPELRAEIDSLHQMVDRLETESLLSGENDARNAIVTIHPGAGGTESQDWADMLLRMYLRWAERQGFQTVLNDYQPGEEAGLKSATFSVNGDYAYGLLASEIGVHRLVRISPFDQAKRRHTSFASVFVSPEIDESIEVEIKPEDLRVDTYRSSGKGGQHVNTTDSAVRITHIPSGIVVSCQNERSQHKNRERAMSMLRSKLYEAELEKKRAETKKIEDSKLDIDFGSQIRSYVLQPYRLVKDHRTKEEVGDVDRVLDGDIQPFIRAYLLMRRGGKRS
ncbi:MAG TPA: peptide chain release factor 2 [Terriglobales bacterium]|nr:peptide chain release factor 2 [Terriglobales bacterium]